MVRQLHLYLEADIVSGFEVSIVRDNQFRFGSLATATRPGTSSTVQTVKFKGILTYLSMARSKQLILLVMVATDADAVLSVMVHAERSVVTHLSQQCIPLLHTGYET